ncbi:unnamed protein product [Hymenolepis diminuta]|uniref:BZIP domain-containing protein n=1 Tax=Hymenolepis diminuta TaxID=6216 RepID=A0A0R3SAG4_HYMDI|nr:unnamed protein product [Hymenolepis diminuta]
MSQFCMDMQDQSPNRPGSLTLRFDSTPNNYADLKSHQHSRNYPVLKRSGSSERDKVIAQLQADCSNNPMTPTTFLNPKDVPADSEQFAEQLTKSFDKIKSEREGPLTEEQLQHHSSSNTSPRATFATANERSTNPSTPIRVKLCNPDDNNGEPVSRSSMLISETYSMLGHGIRSNEAPVISTNISPPSTTGDSTSPVSPALENPSSRFPAVSNAAPPRYALPPLRTGGSNNGGDHYSSLSNMMIAGTTDDPSNNPTLADLTGNQLINPTTDGFVFQHSTDQNTLMGGRMNELLDQRHLTSLVSSNYEGHNFAHQQRHPNDYLSGMPNYPVQDQQQQPQEGLMMGTKRPLQNPPMPSSGAKRGRRRHEPTIAAAQALINASSSGGMGNRGSQLSYLPPDLSAISASSLKMEQQTQQLQTPVSSNAGGPSRRGNHSISMATYDSTSEASLSNLDPSVDKMEKKRARNRLAARRCRERKISKIQSLETEVAQLSAFTETLRVQLATSQKEAEQLRNCVEQLAETIPGVREQLDAIMLSRAQAQHQHPMQSQGVSPNQAHRA